ncbi:polar amino acid ABC transporter ATP-binding protein [Enterococcus plantarum]|uniref:Amino acid ABC transporter ATP-binding protein n=1 Tax=Enterococcus plantarum TaxID=1077675 RepID=A0A2W4BDU3_9ENTE|nr:amino acid ABC transporter ATP-binding protein [Enterococcus plantarum]MBO0422933.1 amino acid ABC transporter ATP-binding protein [Enterococcus plantarum]MBO0466938.1 amino acid ABC transporter ATP-binding protein [Enterococcus plantarum]OEG18497.1 polar amino acid ABC transporter ATP-binding protein [Enterococcus plantarum]PZL74785.1 amino acid ABC transporter ATP-binding protein [Enterococcus plantarum]
MLRIKNLTKSFDSRRIIDQLNLEIKDGEILTIVGPSGGGKTTLLRCLAGLETIDSGELTMDGVPFNPVEMNNADQVVGIVFQDFQLFPHLSVLDNITLAPILSLKQSKEASEMEAMDLLMKFDLHGKENLYPYQLSGGQKQRVALARALAMKPKVLGYDEPTSALDPELRQQVEEVILTLKAQGMTQIVVTHDMNFAENIADNLLTVKPVQ